MSNLFLTQNHFLNLEKWNKFPALATKAMTSILLFFALLFLGTASAQTIKSSMLTCNNPDRCTSKDLEIVSVFIGGDNCQGCTPNTTVTYPLFMTIHNGTKSVRTSFSLYGTLSSGASINGYSGNIFVCVGEITVKSDEILPGETAPGNQTFAVGTITFTCGQDLTLSNNYLAWTDAAGETAIRCETYSKATKCADIAPKCGTASSINIVGPLSAPTLGKVDPTCTLSTGTVAVTSTTTGLKFSLDGGDFTDYPIGGWSGLSSGEHCVRAKNADCTSEPTCITIGGAPANPDRPVVTLQEATICGTVTTPTVTVSCPIAGTYRLTQGTTTTTKTYPSDNLVFPVQPGIGFSITVTTAAGCVSDATTCTNYTTNSCPSISAARLESVMPDIEPETKVAAFPNPYSDIVKFNITPARSGKVSLELYNMLGQKITTVYQGMFEKGKMQTVQYRVPVAQRANLIYILRMDNSKTISGKLIGLKQ
jgi:hypothetical protein